MELFRPNLRALDSLLRGELAAAEIYRYAHDRVSQPRVRACLDDCMQSHARRAQLLRRRMQVLGGIPTRSAGTWGMLVMSTAAVADMFGMNALFDLLQAGEAHGELAYLRKLPKLDPQSRAFVEGQLMPSQQLTREWLGDLKRGGRMSWASIDR